jgi:hypothetical protein
MAAAIWHAAGRPDACEVQDRGVQVQ